MNTELDPSQVAKIGDYFTQAMMRRMAFPDQADQLSHDLIAPIIHIQYSSPPTALDRHCRCLSL